RIHPDRLNARPAQMMDILANLDQLIRASGCKIFRVKDQHHPQLSLQITEPKVLTQARLQGKIRCVGPDLDRHRPFSCNYDTASMRSSAIFAAALVSGSTLISLTISPRTRCSNTHSIYAGWILYMVEQGQITGSRQKMVLSGIWF